MLDATATGAVDIAQNCGPWYAGTIPEASMLWLPLLYDRYGDIASVFYEVQRPIFDQLLQDKANQRVMQLCFVTPQYLWTNKAIHKMEDLQGLKIRAPGGATSVFFESLGASVVSMTASEAVPALQSGALDGVTYSPPSIINYDLYRIIPYMLKPPFQWANGEIHWNLDTWNKLPPDLQEMIEEFSRYSSYRSATVLQPGRAGQWDIDLAKNNEQIIHLSPEEYDRWAVKAKASWEWYTKQTPLCAEILDRTLEYLNKK